jgi:branched-chain amino acid transport system substrate-binding protein
MVISRRELLGGATAVGGVGLIARRLRAQGRPIRIGVINDQSGPNSSGAGTGSNMATRMAVEDFGGGVIGLPIEVLIADHQNKPDIGASIVRKWYDEDGVDIVVDIAHSGVALAVQEITRSHDRIAIYSTVGTTLITESACSPNGFSWIYDAYALTNALVGAIAKQGFNSWYMLVVDYAFGQSLEAEARLAIARSGGKVLGSVRHPNGNPDFSAYLLQAQASGAKVLGLMNGGDDLVGSLKQAREFGMLVPGHAVAAPLVVITDVHAMGLEVAQGLTFATGFYWDRTDATRQFARRFLARQGIMPTMAHAADYSAVTHYLKAVAATGTRETGPVLARMRATPIRDFYCENGQLRVDGRLMHDMYLARVKTPAQSKYEWDYYELLATIPAEAAFRPLSESKCPLVHT